MSKLKVMHKSYENVISIFMAFIIFKIKCKIFNDIDINNNKNENLPLATYP
jgi:hypothetical protein